MKRTVSLRDVEDVIESDSVKKKSKLLLQRDAKTAIETFCVEMTKRQKTIREKKNCTMGNLTLNTFSFEVQYNSKTGSKEPRFVCDELNSLCKNMQCRYPSGNVEEWISDVFFPSFIVTTIQVHDHMIENRYISKGKDGGYHEDVLFHKLTLDMTSVTDEKNSWPKSIKQIVRLTHLLLTSKIPRGPRFRVILFSILKTMLSKLPFLKQNNKHGRFTTTGFLDAIMMRFPGLMKEPVEHRDYRISELLHIALKEITKIKFFM